MSPHVPRRGTLAEGCRFPAVNEFKPGLEGVVAVETEIAEPDCEGGALRYRGVDIEELVGHYAYERVWGLLVDDDLDSTMPGPEPHEPVGLTGNAPADLQAGAGPPSRGGGLGKLDEISGEQAREGPGGPWGPRVGSGARPPPPAHGR